MHNLANIHFIQGNYDEAVKFYRQSLEIAKKLGDQRGIAISLYDLGLLYEGLGKLTVAADYFLKALNIFQKIGDKPNTAKAKADYERTAKQKKQ